ncbi:hypothetical protein [Pseudomonas chlororaphis]|uniref:hypothetical protein n=1 Tax=Pseudomonas chlororaphis TaxID=587753 RepID=UPI00236628EE|nr:hypothetical protein [Pseudomonas chlororaphis]WDG57309.1 hypothetical protein PUP76_21785 [Pseudomonas chlororaphis]WDH91531.1 hypothetical protein PUP74_20400 [Pseudomonas chlororaphis]
MNSGCTKPVCKGDLALDTACGRCERCVAKTPSSNAGTVVRLHHALSLGPEINTALIDLDNAIAKAVDAAKAAGLPQGLIVAELHGHAHAQTHIMVS